MSRRSFLRNLASTAAAAAILPAIRQTPSLQPPPHTPEPEWEWIEGEEEVLEFELLGTETGRMVGPSPVQAFYGDVPVELCDLYFCPNAAKDRIPSGYELPEQCKNCDGTNWSCIGPADDDDAWSPFAGPTTGQELFAGLDDIINTGYEDVPTAVRGRIRDSCEGPWDWDCDPQLVQKGYELMGVDWAEKDGDQHIVELLFSAPSRCVECTKEDCSDCRDFYDTWGVAAEKVYGPDFTDEQRHELKLAVFRYMYGGEPPEKVPWVSARLENVTYDPELDRTAKQA